MSILMDVYEPYSIWELLTQSVDVIKTTLNHSEQGYADYLWYCIDGHRVQVERKQIGELLGGIDAVEEQLSRELGNGVEETVLLVEGFCEPVPGVRSAIQLWVPSKKGNVLVPGNKYNISYQGLQAWYSQLDKSGVTIVQTANWKATAITLVGLYASSQKAEHTTLRRYIKDHIHTTSRNPHILTLMGIKNGGVGEEIAKALIERFGTAWYVLSQDVDTLAETVVGEKRFGPARAKKLLKAIGRTV